MSERGYKGAAVVMIAALAYGMGQCSAKQDTVEPPASIKVVPGPTKTVTKKVTVTKESMPASCKEALRLAKKIDAEATPLVNVASQALDIMADAHESMTMKDGNRLNKLRTDLYALSGLTTKSALALKVQVGPLFHQQMKSCIETDAYKAP